MDKILSSMPRRILGAAFVLSFIGFIIFLVMDSFYRGPLLTIKDLALLKALTLGLWVSIVLLTLLIASKEEERENGKGRNGCLRILIFLILGGAVLFYVAPTLIMEFSFDEFIHARGLKVFMAIVLLSVFYGIFSGNGSSRGSQRTNEEKPKKDGKSYNEQRKNK